MQTTSLNEAVLQLLITSTRQHIATAEAMILNADNPSLVTDTMSGLLSEIENLRAFAQFIIDGYDNQNLNHVDFRVGAYDAALKAIGKHDKAVECALEYFSVKGARDATMPDIKPCPFCGEQPEISTLGSCIDIECCTSMGIQKCDYLTIEERLTEGEEVISGYFSHSEEVESKVLNIAISRWNERV